MVDPWATALATLFVSPGSVGATYTAPGAIPMPIRVIRENGRDQLNSTLFDTETAQIQRCDVASPAVGARITFDDGDRFVIQSPPQLDRERLTWTCPLEPA